jgi:tagatose 1,6-diphosphate aldolase
MDDRGPDLARIKPEVVARGIEEFSQPSYGVTVLKVGLPVNLAFVQGSPVAKGEILYTRREALEHYRRAVAYPPVPFIYLSEGVSNEAFEFGLELAAEAGVAFSGVLCGRATWQDGVPIFARQGAAALEDWLQTAGVRNIENINRCVAAARPWHAAFAANPDWRSPRTETLSRQ